MINKMDICDFIKEHSDDKDAVLVDVRDKTLYEFGSVPGAVNIPIAHPSLLYELPKDKTVYVFLSGRRDQRRKLRSFYPTQDISRIT